MVFEKPDYIPAEEWDEIIERYESIWKKAETYWEKTRFDPVREHTHFTLVLATWAAERANASAHHKHWHTDLLRFR